MATIGTKSGRLGGLTNVGKQVFDVLGGLKSSHGVLTGTVTKRITATERDERTRMALEHLCEKGLAEFAYSGWRLTPRGRVVYEKRKEIEGEAVAA